MRLAREVGGSDLGRLLRTLSQFLREDARTRAELETRQGWTVGAARLALAAPWIVLAMLAFDRRRWRPTTPPPGVAVLFGGAAAPSLALPRDAADRAAARRHTGAPMSGGCVDLVTAGRRVWALVSGTGLWLAVRSSPPMRRPRLDDRLAPYLRDTPRPSRLLVVDGRHAVPDAVERLLGPVLARSRPPNRRRGSAARRRYAAGWTSPGGT